ncbi:acyltransferase [Sphingomonas sp. BIUV-7]|uniref:Acyltransferase n=1 Tax=Sphingomonas natans TaxID=3063330 RepID=A0ABT8YCM7_9SPHN|nr:acyltransferase [Sphingomonas sp. BIUV-7]MDO6416087.1 acyltransferase [Sphingomonas sp. BIUV-7]
MQRYAFLDSLRGIAILGVVMTHVGQSVAGLPPYFAAFTHFGLRGVQLFFMVSALTLCLVAREDNFNPIQFYLRRFFRVAPMFYLAAIFYLLCPKLFGISFASNEVWAVDAITTFLFVHGFNPHGINNVVPGGWSIASEAIFYAIFPWIVLSLALSRRWVILTVLSFAVAFANAAIPSVLNIVDASWRDFFHFNFLTNAPSFATGILLFLALKRVGPKSENSRVAMIGSALVVSSAIAVSFLSDVLPGAQLFMVPALGGVTFVAARYEWPILVNRFLSFFGETSFSIYLVHFGVLHWLIAVAPVIGSSAGQFVILYVFTLIISAFIGIICYKCVERPMVKIGRRIGDRVAECEGARKKVMAPPTVR